MIKKLYYDTPIYTFEGITKAARDFATALDLEYDIMLADTRIKGIFDFDYKFMYNPIDLYPGKEKHIYLKNTRPEQLPYIESENLFFYHVFEGDKLTKKHVDAINFSNNLKCVFFPSTHNAEIAKKSGVEKPIEVIPHVIGENFIPCRNEDFNKTTFYYSGAIFGLSTSDRKGVDLVLKVWKNYEKDKDKQLILKINTMYANNIFAASGKSFKLNDYLSYLYGSSLPSNIVIINENITEYGIIKLYNTVDCILYPSRGEGFGLVPFEGLACGTPCIVTEGLGPDEYLQHLNGKGYLPIKVDRMISPEKRFPYYDEQTGEETLWWEPDFDHFKSQVEYFIANKDKIKDEALESSAIIREKYSHKNISKLFKEYFTKYSIE